jgi:hypothetical protein
MDNSISERLKAQTLTVGSTNVNVEKGLATPDLGTYEGHSKTNVQKFLF